MIRWTLIASIAVNSACQYFNSARVDALLSVVCVLALLIHRRVGAAITALIYLATLFSAHEYLIMAIALILALFPSPRQMVLLLKVQLTVMWIFTGIAKFHPNFRSGEVFRRGPLFLADHLPIESMVVHRQLRPKPSRLLLRKLLAREGLSARRCVLVEDTLDNLKSARSLGLRTVWLTGYLPARTGRPSFVDIRVKSLSQLPRRLSRLAHR